MADLDPDPRDLVRELPGSRGSVRRGAPVQPEAGMGRSHREGRGDAAGHAQSQPRSWPTKNPVTMCLGDNDEIIITEHYPSDGTIATEEAP